jgi:hypothetical protein
MFPPTIPGKSFFRDSENRDEQRQRLCGFVYGPMEEKDIFAPRLTKALNFGTVCL